MMTIAICFVYNLFCWFEFYKISRDDNDDYHYFLVVNSARILYCIGSVTHVSYAGSHMTKQVRKLTQILLLFQHFFIHPQGKFTAVLLHKILNSIQQHKGLEKRVCKLN